MLILHYGTDGILDGSLENLVVVESIRHISRKIRKLLISPKN